MKQRLGWATGTVLAAWFVLAMVRAWQVGATVTQVAPYVYAPILIVLGAWLGWWAGRRYDPRAIAGLVTLPAAYLALGALLTDHPGRGGIGYANANAALAVQLTALAGLVALHPAARRHGLAGVGVSAAALLASASRGGIATGILVLAVVGAAVFAHRARRRWPAVVIALGVCVAAVAVLMSLARRAVWPEWAVSALHAVRKDMWNVGWAAFRRADAFGYGPGGYAQINPWASDTDTVSAHSLPLQVAAELGGVGLILLSAMFLCGLTWATLARSPRAAWIAIAAWTAMASHSFMDHLLEYWPIPLAAGLVLGYGLVAQPDSEAQDQVV